MVVSFASPLCCPKGFGGSVWLVVYCGDMSLPATTDIYLFLPDTPSLAENH